MKESIFKITGSVFKESCFNQSRTPSKRVKILNPVQSGNRFEPISLVTLGLPIELFFRLGQELIKPGPNQVLLVARAKQNQLPIASSICTEIWSNQIIQLHITHASAMISVLAQVRNYKFENFDVDSWFSSMNKICKMQERLLGAALGGIFTGIVVFEQRRCIYNSISGAKPLRVSQVVSNFLV